MIKYLKELRAHIGIKLLKNEYKKLVAEAPKTLPQIEKQTKTYAYATDIIWCALDLPVEKRPAAVLAVQDLCMGAFNNGWLDADETLGRIDYAVHHLMPHDQRKPIVKLLTTICKEQYNLGRISLENALNRMELAGSLLRQRGEKYDCFKNVIVPWMSEQTADMNITDTNIALNVRRAFLRAAFEEGYENDSFAVSQPIDEFEYCVVFKKVADPQGNLLVASRYGNHLLPEIVEFVSNSSSITPSYKKDFASFLSKFRNPTPG